MWSISQNVRTVGHSPAFWLCGGIALATVGANLTAGDRNPQSPANQASLSVSAEPAAAVKKTVREGARIESQVVRAKMVGDKLLLDVESDNKSFEGLENLALQRIAQSLQEDTSDARWIVSGQITEFKEQNFLLLERVIRAPAAKK